MTAASPVSYTVTTVEGRSWGRLFSYDAPDAWLEADADMFVAVEEAR